MARELPLIDNNATIGEHAERLVAERISHMGHIYRDQGKMDFGVDGHIEISEKIGEGRAVATGRLLGVQVKSGFTTAMRTKYGMTVYIDNAHVNYWTGHTLPIILVHYNPVSKVLNWKHVTNNSLRKGRVHWALDLPTDSNLSDAADEIARIARNEDSSYSRKPFKPFVFDEDKGFEGSDEELGVSLLEAMQEYKNSNEMFVDIAYLNELEIAAGVNYALDAESPTLEDRRQAILLRDIIDRYELNKATMIGDIEKFIKILEFNKALSVDPACLGRALQLIGGFHRFPRYRGAGSIAMDSWPGGGKNEPVVTFDINKETYENIVKRTPSGAYIIRSGLDSDFVALELDDEAYISQFLPAFVRYLNIYATNKGVSFEELVAPPHDMIGFWKIGLR